MKKLLSLVLAAVLTLGLLAGCGAGSAAQPAPEATEAPAATTAPAAAEAPADETPGETPDAEQVDLDFAAMYAYYAPDYVPLKLNGRDVTWSRFFGWMYSLIDQLVNYYGVTDFSAELGEGLTFVDYIRDYAESMSAQYALVNAKAEELGLTLSAEELEEVDRMIQSDADDYFGGDVNALFEDLRSRYFTEEYYREMSGASLLYQDIFRHYFGDEGSLLPDEDAVNFFLDNGYMNAKHILFKTVDDTNAPLSEEEQAEKLAQAQEVLAQLQAADPETLEETFDKIMLEQTEDPGSITRPDGYYFTSGMMVPEFEEAAAALEQGGLSEIVKSDYGYHILYRPNIDPEHVYTYDSYGSPVTVRYEAATGLFRLMVDEWTDTMVVEYAPDFDVSAVLDAGAAK